MDKTINNNRVTMRDLYSLAEKLDEKIDSISNQVANLPCKLHEFRISNLEKGRERNCNNNRIERRLTKSIRGNITAQILGGLIGAGATVIIARFIGWW